MSNALPVFEQWSPWKPNPLSPSSFTPVEHDVIFEHDVTAYGVSLWPNLVRCPRRVPFQLLAHLSQLAYENFHIYKGDPLELLLHLFHSLSETKRNLIKICWVFALQNEKQKFGNML